MYVLARPVIHPGTMEEIISVGSVIQPEDLHWLQFKLGIDEVLCHICYDEDAAERMIQRLSE